MKIIRLFFKYLIIPLTISLYFLNRFFHEDTAIYENIFNILLTSSIGFYTNVIAIKLLFKPKDKTEIFKLHGLIPQNQTNIAESLGKAIKEQFLNPLDIAIYALENKLDEKIVDTFFSFAKSDKIFITANKILKERVITNNDFLTLIKSPSFKYFISNLIDEIYENKINITDFIYDKLTDNINWFAKKLAPIIGKGQSASKNKILSMFESFEKEKLKEEIINLLIDAENSEKLVAYINKIIKKKADDNIFWDELVRNSRLIIEKTEKSIIEKFLNKGIIFTFLLENLDNLFKHVEFDTIISSKIINYDSDSFEKMINDLMKEHLSFIEVSGGILGLIAGISLFNIPVFLGIIGVIYVSITFDLLFTRYKRKKDIETLPDEDDLILLCAFMIRKDGITRMEEIVTFEKFYDEAKNRYKFKKSKSENMLKLSKYTSDNYQFDTDRISNITANLKKTNDYNFIRRSIFTIAISDNELHDSERKLIKQIE